MPPVVGRVRGLDKTARMHIVSPIFESGKVWYPSGEKFADEVIEEVASFPNGDHDDFCDSMTMALMRFRQGGFVRLDGEDLKTTFQESGSTTDVKAL